MAVVRAISSRIVYENAWMSVREDEVVAEDGARSVYGVVDKADFALVLAREEGGFWMVEQYRYPARRRAWEFPMGSWPAGRSGTPLALAQAELAEETGLTAAAWTHLGHLLQAYGYSSQGFDVFLAEQLTEGAPDREATEQDMVHRFVADDELDAMIRAGDVVDASTLAALAVWQLSLR
jgi:8-oxo-dGTP pyrophosphatase MutT (NUDIX family)